MKRLLDALALLAGWWILGIALWVLWFISAGDFDVPELTRRGLPREPEDAFVAGAMCFGVGVGKAAGRLRA